MPNTHIRVYEVYFTFHSCYLNWGTDASILSESKQKGSLHVFIDVYLSPFIKKKETSTHLKRRGDKAGKLP